MGITGDCSRIRFCIVAFLKVLAVVPTDKTLPTGERCLRFKAFVVAGDANGHVGLGVQISKEVAVAIAGDPCVDLDIITKC